MSQHADQPADKKTPWERLCTRFSGLLEPSNPYEPPPDTPPELKQWMVDVSSAMCVCMMLNGWRQHRLAVQQPIQIPAHLPTALHNAFLQSQQNNRLAKVGTAAVVGAWFALRMGGAFYGIDAVGGIAAGQPCKEVSAGSGFITGAVCGGSLSGNIPFKLSRAGLGGAMGTLAGLLHGWITHHVIPSL
jgi:hypothetical protein